MLLNEVLDSSAKNLTVHTNDEDTYDAEFSVNGKTFSYLAMKGDEDEPEDNAWRISVGEVTEDGPDFAPTGNGDEFAVLGAVKQITLNFLAARRDVSAIAFDLNTKAGGHSYAKILQAVDIPGWQKIRTNSGDKIEYRLVNPNRNQQVRAVSPKADNDDDFDSLRGARDRQSMMQSWS